MKNNSFKILHLYIRIILDPTNESPQHLNGRSLKQIELQTFTDQKFETNYLFRPRNKEKSRKINNYPGTVPVY